MREIKRITAHEVCLQIKQHGEYLYKETYKLLCTDQEIILQHSHMVLWFNLTLKKETSLTDKEKEQLIEDLMNYSDLFEELEIFYYNNGIDMDQKKDDEILISDEFFHKLTSYQRVLAYHIYGADILTEDMKKIEEEVFAYEKQLNNSSPDEKTCLYIAQDYWREGPIIGICQKLSSAEVITHEEKFFAYHENNRSFLEEILGFIVNYKNDDSMVFSNYNFSKERDEFITNNAIGGNSACDLYLYYEDLMMFYFILEYKNRLGTLTVTEMRKFISGIPHEEKLSRLYVSKFIKRKDVRHSTKEKNKIVNFFQKNPNYSHLNVSLQFNKNLNFDNDGMSSFFIQQMAKDPIPEQLNPNNSLIKVFIGFITNQLNSLPTGITDNKEKYLVFDLLTTKMNAWDALAFLSSIYGAEPEDQITYEIAERFINNYDDLKDYPPKWVIQLLN